MAVRTEELQLRVLIDGTPARRELATLDQEYAKINSELRDLKRNTQEYTAATARLGDIRQRQEALRKEIGLTSLTAKQLTDELRNLQIANRNLTPNSEQWAENAQRIEQVKNRLRELNDVNVRAQAAWEAQRKGIALTTMTMEQLELESRRLGARLRTLDPNTDEFVNLRRELNAVDDRMRLLRTGLGPFGRAWAEVKGQILGAVGVLGSFVMGGAVIEMFRGLVRGSAELSDAQADVQRTTGLTRDQVNALTQDLSKLNTRTARSELLALAAEAGKLGITAREDVLQFVRAGDQIRVALGEDLGEDAITNIGKLNQTFQVGAATGKNLEEQMLATGSAVNALGQTSTAQEAYLVDFTTRMAGVNTQAGINIQNTLGYAAALDQLGQRSETSSTALSQFTLKAFQETATYARIAGMGVEEFTALLNSDTNEALLRVLEGLQGNNEGLTRMTALFSDLGQEGARAVGVLSSLANNTKLVREQQQVANQAFAEGTSITNEFNAKNSTLAANLDIIGKRLVGAFVNSGVVAGINRVAAGLREMVSPSIADGIENERQALFRLYSQILTTNEGSAERIKLVNELQAKYPQLLGNLNAETTSNDELAKAVGQVNEQLINRIIIAQQQERIDDEIEKIARARQERLEREDDVLKQLEATARKYGVQLQAGANVLEQSQRTYALIKEAQDKLLQGRSAGGVLVNDVARLGNAIFQLSVAQAQENERSAVGNRLLEQKTELMQRLGIEAESAAEATGDAVNPAPNPEGVQDVVTPGGLTDPQRQKLAEQWERWRTELAEVRERLYQDGLTSDERDLRQLDVKHANELARLMANQAATQADLLALDAAQAQERADLIAAQGEERLKGYSEAAERIREAMLSDAERELDDEVAKWDQLIALGQKYGLDVTALEEKKEMALAAIRKKYRDKEKAEAAASDREALQTRLKAMQDQIALAQAFGGMLGGLNSLMQAFYKETEENAWEHAVAAKTLALIQINVAAAVAIAEAIKSIMADPTAPFIVKLGYALGAAGTVMGAVAQAYDLLNATPNSPQQNANAAMGGNVQNVPLGAQGGVFEGPGHDQGGLKVFDPTRQRVVAEVEGGEPWMVLSRAFRRNNPGLVPRLLQASATGERLHIAAGGGLFGPMRQFNFTSAGEALRGDRRMVRGNALVNSRRAPGDGTGAADDLLKVNMAMLKEMQEMKMATLAYPTQVRAVVSTQDMERRKVELDRLRDRAKVRR
jgi:TP901 family phage tail tape measure protein